MRVGLFTNNYLPFRGGVTTAVETLREGLDALGHRAWVFAPAPARPLPEPAFVFRYPSVPAPTYPGFALPLPLSPRLARTARQLQLQIFHAQHPLLLGPAARRLAREKSVERIIEAFASVAEAVSGARLLVVGQGSHAGPLERRAAASRAHERIHFLGGVAREELPPYYQAADLFLFASETETQGLVLAEAHACARPAVSVRGSGVDEGIRSGATGLLTKRCF